MAFLAVFTVTALVHVVQLVAGVALDGGFDVLLIDVAAGADHLVVGSGELEFGLIVVKVDLAPMHLVMTGIAAFE